MRKDGLVVDGETYAQKVNAYRASLRADVETTLTYADRMYAAQVEEKVLAYKTSLDAELRDTAEPDRRVSVEDTAGRGGPREIRRIVAERGTSSDRGSAWCLPDWRSGQQQQVGPGHRV